MTIRNRFVLVPFPFDDLSGTKVRPAVCLTEPVGLYKHVVLAFITSRIPSTLSETDIVIDSNASNFSAAGLRVSSTLQLHRLMTVTLSIIKRELGVMSPQLQSEVNERLRKLFGIN